MTEPHVSQSAPSSQGNSGRSSMSGASVTEARTALLKRAARDAMDYLEGVGARSVAPTAEAVQKLSSLRGPLPPGPTNPEAVLHLLNEYGSPATMAKTSGRFFGFVTGDCLPAALAASWLVSAWDQNAAHHAQSPVAAELEETAIDWVREIFGLPAGTGGAVTTGATMANFSALAAARHTLLQRAGWDVEADGLFGAPPITVVVGEEVHQSVVKALGLLGLGRKRVVRVPVDSQGRMRADALPHLDANTILCLQAGNVNTGAFDPAAAICPAKGLSWPTRGRQMATSGPISATTAASCWCVSRQRCGRPCPSRPRTWFTRKTATHPTTIPSYPGVRAAWNCGPVSARWAAREWRRLSSAPQAMRAVSRQASKPPASKCSTTWSSTRSWFLSAARKGPSAPLLVCRP